MTVGQVGPAGSLGGAGDIIGWLLQQTTQLDPNTIANEIARGNLRFIADHWPNLVSAAQRPNIALLADWWEQSSKATFVAMLNAYQNHVDFGQMPAPTKAELVSYLSAYFPPKT